MACLVRLEGIGPVKIDPATLPLGSDGKPKKIAVCTCGMSARFPICDGTHKQLAEEPGRVYCYDAAVKSLIETPQGVVMRDPLLPSPSAPASPAASTPPAAPSDASR